MKIGIIAKPNTKGQFVIPHAFRKKLGIVSGTPINVVVREDSIVLYPLAVNHTRSAGAINYYNTLVGTRGAWSAEKSSSKSPSVYEKKARKLELFASSKRKAAW